MRELPTYGAWRQNKRGNGIGVGPGLNWHLHSCVKVPNTLWAISLKRVKINTVYFSLCQLLISLCTFLLMFNRDESVNPHTPIPISDITKLLPACLQILQQNDQRFVIPAQVHLQSTGDCDNAQARYRQE